MADPAEDPTVRDAIRDQVNEGLAQGGLYGAVLAGTSSLGVITALIVTGNPLFRLASLFALLCLASTLILSWAGRTERVQGAGRFVVMVPFVSLPTFYFLAAEALFPAGMASVINGPFSYAYLFLIGLTGFVFDFRVSLVCGIAAAVQYLFCFSLAAPTLALIDAPDPLLYQDLTHPFVALNKGLVMVAMGAATGGLTLIARKLLFRTIEAQHRKDDAQHVLGQYLAEAVRSRLGAADSIPRSTRAHAVILFSELRGLDPAAHSEETPERLLGRLDDCLERIGGAVRAEGGTVDKVLGSSVLAVFGGLAELDAPASHAVCAALRMRDVLRALNAERAREGLAPLEGGIGVHQGEVVVGAAGPAGKKELTAFGTPVRVAIEMGARAREQCAGIMVSEAVFADLEPTEQGLFEPLGQARLTEDERPSALYATRGGSVEVDRLLG